MSSQRPAPPAPEPLSPLIDAHTHLDACGATDGASVTAIVDRASMKEAVFGPAIIEDAWSTVVIPPGWQAKPDTIGHLFLTKVTP